MNISKLVRSNVAKLKPYSSARDEFEGSASVFLDANENPFPEDLNRYPDPLQRSLKKKIAALKNIDESNLFLGNGSDEPIDLLIRAFCEPAADNVLILQPTYGMYEVCANINNVGIISLPLQDDFDIDLTATINAWNSKTKIIFLCSPNNPTGNLLDSTKIKSILKAFEGIVVVDEAYIDFADSPGLLQDLKDHQNLVILQTLSKAWGLAAIRLGMCFADKQIISILNKVKPPYNINLLTQREAESRLQAQEKVQQWVNEIKSMKSEMVKSLNVIPFVLKVYPSSSNFLLVKMKSAKAVYDFLISKGIVVRDRSNVILCDNCLRITIGTPSENQILINTLQRFK